MDSNSVSILLLVGLPLLLALGIALVFWLVRRWRAEIGRHAHLSAQSVEGARQQLFDLRQVQEEYASLHRQPYADLSADLSGLIEAAEKRAAELESAWGSLNDRRNKLPASKLGALVNAAPETYQQRKLALDLADRRDALAEHLAAAEGITRRLHAVPAEIAAQAGQAQADVGAFEGLMGEMHRAGLHGRMMDEADDALLRLQQSCERIPSDFGVQAADAESAQPHSPEAHVSASDVYDLLRDIQPVVGEWLPRVQSWQQQHQRALESYAHLQKTSANFRAALSLPPAVLIVTHFQAGLLQVDASAAQLAERLRHAEIQELRGLDREINHLERVLQETAGRFDLAVQETARLDRLLLELESSYKILAARLKEAEMHESYPLNWDHSRPIQTDLQQKIAALGTRDQRRTPEQIVDCLSSGVTQLETLTALLARTGEMAGMHLDLAGLLDGADLYEGADWTAKALPLARAVGDYDPQNWNRQEEVPSLLKDLAALEEQQQKLVPPERPAVIKESALARRLEETRQLSVLHQRLRPRLERVRARLNELRQQEKTARDELDRALAALEQLGQLFNGSSYLQEIGSAELGKQRAELSRLEEEFNHPETGVLERKTARLNTDLDGLSRALTLWQDRLSSNLQVHLRSISDSLAALDQVAFIEDREVSEARDLLRRLGLAPSYPRPAAYLDALTALKRCAADWQAAAASAAALDQAGAPVLGAARDAERARKAARDHYQSSAKFSDGRREWPPVRALPADLGDFRKLEARLDGLRSQRWSAGRLVRELDLIYHEMDKLGERSNQAVRQAEGERGAAQDLERSVEDLQRRWQQLSQRFPDQPALEDEIRDLLSQTDQRLSYLRSQYRRGAMDYDQAVASLEDLDTSLRSARFTTSDGRPVGVSSD